MSEEKTKYVNLDYIQFAKLLSKVCYEQLGLKLPNSKLK